MREKNVIISCLNRAPGSSIEEFKDWLGEMFSKNNPKVVLICGDLNIDLLNPNKHKLTDGFINTIYSMGLYPKITRPSRITFHCATLIHNIFTNNFVNNTVSGLLISDHLPVFTVYNSNYKRNQPNGKRTRKRIYK